MSSEHRPPQGSLGFITQAEQQAGAPRPLSARWHRLPTRSLLLSESQHPWGLHPRWTVSGLGPNAQCLRARSGLRRSSGSPDRRVSRFSFQLPPCSAFRPGLLPPAPSRPGPTAPAERPRSCPLVPHLPFVPLAPPAQRCFAFLTANVPRVPLCSVRSPPLFFHWARCLSAGAFSLQPRTMRGPRRQPAPAPVWAAPLASLGRASSFTRTGSVRTSVSHS